MKAVDSKIEPSNKKSVKDAVKDFIKKSKMDYEKASSKSLSTDELDKLVIASILHKNNGDVEKSNNMVAKIPAKNLVKALKTVDKVYADQLLEPEKTITTTEEVIPQLYDIPKTIDQKSPEHIFKKRQVDFEKNLKTDFENSFKN